MTHYMSVVASLAIRRSTASTQPANLLLIPERTNEYARHLCIDPTNPLTPTNSNQDDFRLTLLDALRHVDRIPFPGLALIRREGLTPVRPLRISRVPSEDNDDVLSFVRAARKEVACLVQGRPTSYHGA